ncbi:hypothetical protein [Dactylosporangium sp. NPDC051541]|uniref:hypothetical protein n=1 Tax=Dactylosporangium sp. NPDC051541 TaxID=3363977 RepID=UPI0037A3186D
MENNEQMRIDRQFGTVVREGAWLVPPRVEVRLAAANARLDFTAAVPTSTTVDLDVDLGLGSELTLVVPPGVKVIADDLDARQGDYEVRTMPDPNADVHLTVRVSGRLHAGGDLIVRAP